MDAVGRTSHLHEHTHDYLRTRGALLLVIGYVALAVGAGAWALTSHDPPAAYSMSGDTRPRLPDGTIASGTSMSVAEAIARRPAHAVAVHGYLMAAADDWPYLCTRLNEFTDCRGA